MSNRARGDRRERQAKSICEDADYIVDSKPNVRFQSGDFFKKFDIIAVRPDKKPKLIQVKSNSAREIRETIEWVEDNLPDQHFDVEYWVCHDQEGWRLININNGKKDVVVDERDMDVNMGEELRNYIDPDD